MAKALLWIVVGLLVTGIAFWMITTEQGGGNPAVVFLVVVIFAVPPIGAFWMLYMSIRYEKNIFPVVLMALFPYGFLWYYLERVRTGKYRAAGRHQGDE